MAATTTATGTTAAARMTATRATATAGTAAGRTAAAARTTATPGAPAAAAGLTVPGCPFAPLGGGRCGHCRQVHSLDGGARNLMANVALYIGQRDGIFLATEADGVAFGAGAC